MTKLERDRSNFDLSRLNKRLNKLRPKREFEFLKKIALKSNYKKIISNYIYFIIITYFTSNIFTILNSIYIVFRYTDV